MRTKHAMLALVGAGLVASLSLSQAGVASAATGEASSARLLSSIQDLAGFSGYTTTSNDLSASVILTVPNAESCDAPEISGGFAWMGDDDSSYATGLMAALCQPGAPGTYGAAVQTADGGQIPLTGPLTPGDHLKVVISDDGTNTTVTLTNLDGGESVSESTPSVPNLLQIGAVGVLPGLGMVGGKLSFTKAHVDGAKLKAAHPTKVTFSDPSYPAFKVSKLKKGQNFNVTNS